MTTNTEALREQFELYVNPEGDIKLHRLVDGSYAGHGLNQSWMDFQAGHAAGVAAEREVEMSEELPAVARLYYSGNGPMPNDTTPVPIGADGALALLVAAVEAETDQSWECNSYHPSLWSALNVARAALATAAQPPAGFVLVPIELAQRVQETMGEFLMDHGWRQQDMDTYDEFDAALAAKKSAS